MSRKPPAGRAARPCAYRPIIVPAIPLTVVAVAPGKFPRSGAVRGA